MSAGESHLMVAQAIVKGLASGDAASHYQLGIQHAMGLWGADASAYLASDMGTLSGSNEEKIELAKEFQIEVARNLVSTYEGGDVEKVYLDSRGKPTVGVGHLLVGDEINQYKVGDVVPQEVREAWFAKDFTKALEAAKEQNQVLTDAGHKPIPQDYLTSLNFQLGTSWYKDFKKAWLCVFVCWVVVFIMDGT